MTVQAQVHSTTKRAIVIIGIALLFAATLVGVRRFSSPAPQTTQQNVAAVNAAFIAPVVTLRIADAATESAWSAALAATLSGRTEVPVQNGRIDVLSDFYAIEVDRLEKWHEGIGQASHYALATGKTACLALIIDSDRWPLNETTLTKLRLIEQTALARGVKLLVLRRMPTDA